MLKEIEKFVGKTAEVTFGKLTVKVLVKDIKSAYGRDLYLITPVEGSGEQWVEKVTLSE